MEEELAIKAAKLFTSKPWKHNSKPRPNKCCGLYCTKCKVEFTKQNGELDKPCTVPDPIDINWDNAMKLVRDGDAKYMKRVIRALQEIAKSKVGIKKNQIAQFALWLIFEATPADFVEAAIIAKEKSNESK